MSDQDWAWFFEGLWAMIVVVNAVVAIGAIL
jgi:hypothetical protein